MHVDWIALSGFVFTLVTALFATFKWFLGWAEQRDAEQEKYFNKRLDDIASDIDNLDSRFDTHIHDLGDIKSELHNEFVKHAEMETLRKELREDFNNVFQKMGGISKALNQLIGAVNGKVHGD